MYLMQRCEKESGKKAKKKRCEIFLKNYNTKLQTHTERNDQEKKVVKFSFSF